MTTLREAAQMALDALELVDGYVMGKHEAKEALYEALAQPEQEPWGYISHRSWKMPVFVEAENLEVSGLPFNNPNYTPVYKAPPQREWCQCKDAPNDCTYENNCRVPQIDAAFKRIEWQGLTDEEISKIYASTDWNDNEDWDYERAIEAKLREKNFDRFS